MDKFDFILEGYKEPVEFIQYKSDIVRCVLREKHFVGIGEDRLEWGKGRGGNQEGFAIVQVKDNEGLE